MILKAQLLVWNYLQSFKIWELMKSIISMKKEKTFVPLFSAKVSK